MANNCSAIWAPLRLETYIQDAERDGDNDVAELFRKAQSDSRKALSRHFSVNQMRL
ncbi:hypothetical protein MAHJHV47_45310 [Mycobacterium avium subsp. hominissuis]